MTHAQRGYLAFPALVLLGLIVLSVDNVSKPLLIGTIVGWVVFYWSYLHLRTNVFALVGMFVCVTIISLGSAIFLIGRWGGPQLPGYSIVNTQVGTQR